MTEEASELIATIIREQDVETVLEDVAVEAAVEIDAILDDAVISDATETLRQPKPNSQHPIPANRQHSAHRRWILRRRRQPVSRKKSPRNRR